MTGPSPDSVLLAARIAASSGAWSDVRASLERDEPGAQRDGAHAMLLAEACLRTGDPRTAERWLDTAAPLLARSGDRPALRKTLNMQGAAAFALGTLETAEQRWSVALAMAQTDDDALLTARTTNNLGLIAALTGQSERAIAAYKRAIPSFHRLGHVMGLAESWHNLAISYRTRGDLDDAEDAERQAIEYATDVQNTRLVAMANVGRAEISLRRGDSHWARATAARAVTVFAGLPDFLLLADALRVQADACDRLTRHEAADALIVRALEVAREHSHRTQEAQALQTQAQMRQRRGDLAAARGIGEMARDAFSTLGAVADAEEMAEFLAALGR